MKSGIFRKVLAIVLALSMALVPVLSASAAETVTEQQSAKAPYILIRGFMSSDIYAVKGDDSSDKVWPPTTKEIVPAVFKLLPSLFRVILTKNYGKFTDKALPIINDLLFSACLDESGKPSNGSGIAWEYPSDEEIKAGTDLEFKYDWRLDPTEIAVELDKFIDHVSEVSGSEKVCLECRSFGGVVALTYAGLYGSDKIQSIVFNASAVYGAGFSGELFNGRMTFDADALTEFLKAAFAFNKSEKFLNGLFAFLNKIGTTDRICNFLNGLLEEEGETLLRESLFPLFGCWPSTWAMISDKNVDSSYDFVFGTVFPESAKYDGLKKTVKNFDTVIRKHRVDILNDLNENCNLYVISKHGFCSMFLTPEWDNVGDMVIECENSSFGATVAPYGETLSAAQLSGKDKKYVSPDKKIDASTCLYPEQTWFIENLTHSKVFDSSLDFTKALLYHDGQATVDTMAGYSRFMILEEDGYTLVPAK